MSTYIIILFAAVPALAGQGNGGGAEDYLTLILAADIAAILGLVALGIKFIGSQSARIARTELRLGALETAISELRERDTDSDVRYTQIVERLARLEAKLEACVNSQNRILALLESGRGRE